MTTTTTQQTLSERDVRTQVQRIVLSAAFRTSDRLKHFITFVTDEALQGRAEQLKEYSVGVHVFGRETAFDPRTDPVVRVQARRLRARLDRYYRDEGQQDQVLIDLPKGGYAPVFRRRDIVPTTDAVSDRPAGAKALVLVQPVSNDTSNAAADRPCAALTHEVIRRLTALPGVLVAPAADRPAADGLLFDGRLAEAHDGWRLAVSVTNLATRQYEFCDSIDVPTPPDFAEIDRIADQIAERLRPHLPNATPPPPRQTSNLTARNLCKQGLYHLDQRTDESLERAAELFERAVIEDAQYSLAHSGLSDAYSMLGSYGLRPTTTMVTAAMSSAATAVMLDSESAPARTSLAHAKARAHWNWMEAALDFQHAIRLDPAYATGHHWYARCCLVPLGRLDEARDEVLLAQALDPVSSIIAREVASIHYYRRDFEAALAHCDHAIELNPHFPHAYFVLSLVQEELGDFDEALAALLRGAQLAPHSPRMIASLGRAMARAGRRDEAIRALERLTELERVRHVSAWERAILYLGLHDYEECFRQLTLALADKFFDLTLLGVDPRFDDIRQDPRFADVLHRVGVR